MRRPVVCSLGSTDPWNAAGLGLDLLALAECGAYGVTVVAGVTAQDRAGVHAQFALPVGLVSAQLAALAGADVAAYRIGALLDVATIEAVAEHLTTVDVPVVYDPALAPSGGGSFGNESIVEAIRERLLPLVDVVTPNLSEAASLSGVAVVDEGGMEGAGQILVSAGAHAALIKGGHLADRLCDVLVSVSHTQRFEATRLPGTLRGTGCLLAASLAAGLARGTPLEEAVLEARAFVRSKFARANERGGMRLAY